MGGKRDMVVQQVSGRLSRVRRAVAVMLALSIATLVPALAPATPATAATEIGWYLATPGFVRTNLQPTHVVGAPGTGSFYAVLNGDTSTWTLLKISIDTFAVTQEVQMSGLGRINDIEVSAAGALYVLTSTSVSHYRTSDLALVERVQLESGDPRSQLAVANDRTDRFAIFDPLVFEHAIYTGGQRTTLDGLGLDNIGVVGFGTDSDQVLAVDSDGFSPTNGVFATFDISASPVMIDIVDDWMDGLGSVGTTVDVYGDGDDFVVVSTSDERTTVFKVDGQSLAIRETRRFALEAGKTEPVIDASGEQIFSENNSRKTMSRAGLFEDSVEATTWTFPVEGYVVSVEALGGGLVAGFERFDGPEYLIIASSNVLGSGFGDYHAVTPERLLDTREAIGVPRAQRLEPGETISVQVAGRGELPVDGVLAVTMNATVTEPTGPGFIKVWPSGSPFPEVSNLNYVTNQTVANAVTVTIGSDGKVQIYNSDNAATHVLLDITGYYSNTRGPRGAQYFDSVAPQRLLDTRDGSPSRTLGPGEFIDVEVPISLPRQDTFFVEGTWVATAAVLTVTAVGGTAPSYLAVYPSDVAVRPTTSTLNFVAGDIRSNSVVATLPDDNTVRIYNRAGTVDVVVDLFGRYMEFRVADFEDQILPVEQSGRYYPTVPFRRFDSREDSPFPGTGALEPGSALILGNSVGWTDIWNVTATQPTRAGFLSVLGYEDGDGLGAATSNVNFIANETIATVAYATGKPDNAIYNANGNTHVIVDVFGYLTPPSLSPIDTAFTQFGDGGLTAGSLVEEPVPQRGADNRDRWLADDASNPLAHDLTWFNPPAAAVAGRD